MNRLKLALATAVFYLTLPLAVLVMTGLYVFGKFLAKIRADSKKPL